MILNDSKENYESGYIKSYRSTIKKGWYTKSDYFHLWHHLLYKATHKEKEVMFAGKNIKLKPGQFITGRKTLESETGISESKITRILLFFEKNANQIEQQTSNKNRLVTILNWDLYQFNEINEQQANNKKAAKLAKLDFTPPKANNKITPKNTVSIQESNKKKQNEQQPNNNRTTTEQQPNTNKNVKKVKKNITSAKAKADLSIHQEFIITYEKWYEKKTGVLPVIQKHDAVHAANIRKYFEKLGSDPIKSLKYILNNWDKLDAFHQKQTTLSQIYGNLNNIVAKLKEKKDPTKFYAE